MKFEKIKTDNPTSKTKQDDWVVGMHKLSDVLTDAGLIEWYWDKDDEKKRWVYRYRWKKSFDPRELKQQGKLEQLEEIYKLRMINESNYRMLKSQLKNEVRK